MRIIHLNEQTLAAGKEAFREYLATYLCGQSSSAYTTGLNRSTGPRILPGAISACIEQGMTDAEAIIHAASRVSRCNRSTVELMLTALSGNNPNLDLWGITKGGFYVHSSPAERPAIILAS